MQVWYYVYMHECDHQLVPIVYGYLYGEILDSINSYESIYGGSTKTSSSPEWFCNRCLEEIIL
jgi:hypothetical protein